MSTSQHPRTCDELAVCQNRQPPCPGCAPFDRQDLIVIRTAALCALVLFLVLALENFK